MGRNCNQILSDRGLASISSHKDFQRNFLSHLSKLHKHLRPTAVGTHESTSGCKCILTFLRSDRQPVLMFMSPVPYRGISENLQQASFWPVSCGGGDRSSTSGVKTCPNTEGSSDEGGVRFIRKPGKTRRRG